ncbi:SusC/RagA family TonB-linked outer membrane protein [Chryseolinea sp. H1M3-3]|uniref:SusC/RagA family TonB-linked outer membrane protein n=1 Tax=Chryseolinea sp. H1M3-3 TaxID=3034144 RepID=UPI0023EDD7F1|nr:SusC/RagA family TonB-linked outer membrane protein [Chryseolinea sp. H1M3-3]
MVKLVIQNYPRKLATVKTSLIFCVVLTWSFNSFCQHVQQDSIETKVIASSAVAKLDYANFNQGVIHTPYPLFNGHMTGLGMSTAGHDPNGEFLLRVRGLSTFQNKTGPLLVVDGFITNDFQLVDPNDIGQVMLLKDAAAASAYGVQGGNGVLLISTKKGGDENALVSFRSTLGLDQPIRNMNIFSASKYRSFPGSVDMGSTQDWPDLVTRTGIASINALTISKSTETFSLRTSINNRIARGTLSGSGFDQLNFRINFQQRALKDRLLMEVTLASTSRNSDFGFREAIKYAFSANPTMPVYDPAEPDDGGYSQSHFFDDFNPVAIIEQNKNEGKERSSSIGFNGAYQFDARLKGLGIKFSYQLLHDQYFNGSYYSKNSYYRGASTNGMAIRNTDTRRTQQAGTSITYFKDLKNVHFEISSGYQFLDYDIGSIHMQGGNFLTDAFGYNNIGASLDFQNGIGMVSSARDSYKVISWTNTASMLFHDKYFLNATTTTSGSSRLGKNNKWGLFPSLGGGIQWEEGLSFFSHLKLRASWGKAGNIPQQSNLSRALMSPSDYMYYEGNYIPAYYTTRDANPDLKWEGKSELNIGVDFRLLNDRVSGNIDWFNNNVEDLISSVSIATPPNLSSTKFANLGEIQNRGVELNLNIAMRKTMQFSWDLNFNISRIKTKVNSLQGNGYALGSDGKIYIGTLTESAGCGCSAANLIQEGAVLGQIHGPIFSGVDPDGRPKHADLNGDGGYCNCPDDFAVLGNGLPKVLLGFGHHLSYKNFEMDLLLRGAFGHDKINSYRLYQEGTEAIAWSNLVETSYFDPRLRNAPFSSRYVENASFLNLDNISLRYHFPSAFKFSVAVTIQNLFTITKYSGPDPGVAYENPILKGATTFPVNTSPLVSGIDQRGNYLPSRIFSLDVNVKL